MEGAMEANQCSIKTEDIQLWAARIGVLPERCAFRTALVYDLEFDMVKCDCLAPYEHLSQPRRKGDFLFFDFYRILPASTISRAIKAEVKEWKSRGKTPPGDVWNPINIDSYYGDICPAGDWKVSTHPSQERKVGCTHARSFSGARECAADLNLWYKERRDLGNRFFISYDIDHDFIETHEVKSGESLVLDDLPCFFLVFEAREPIRASVLPSLLARKLREERPDIPVRTKKDEPLL